MRLLVFAYHRATAGPFGNDPAMLDAHFGHLALNYNCVLPGEPLDRTRLNVCLTFDDATFDFHAVVFPLLGKHGLRALLAICPGFARERVDASAEERLKERSDAADAHPSRGGFCTWPELQELADSGRIAVAAHGYTHRRLDQPGTDLSSEILVPQSLLAARLGQPVESFVFPYGRFSPEALDTVRKSYRHAVRLGGAGNHSWSQRLIYRIDADGMESPDALFKPSRLAAYRARYLWNRIRLR